MKSEKCAGYLRFQYVRFLFYVQIVASIVLYSPAARAQSGSPHVDSFSSINLSAFSDQSGVIALNGTNYQTIRWWSDEELTILIGALGEISTVPMSALPTNRWGGVVGSTYWSLQNPGMPPIPVNTIGADVWRMSDGSFLLNDLDFEYGGFSAGRSMMSMDFPFPGGGTNFGTPEGLPTGNYDYGTNLWIAQTSIGSGYLSGIGSNTIADVPYEIQSRTNLAQTDWQSEGFIYGSELTNWTPLSVWQAPRTNLFIRLKSWADDTGTGIPDWWWLQFFGQITNVDLNASAAGDGFSNLAKFQRGLNPTNYYNPNGPPGFFGYLDATGTNVFIAWNPAPGPVINYSIQRGISNIVTHVYAYSQVGTVNSNVLYIKDAVAFNNSNALKNVYNLEAVYPGGSLSATDTWYVSWSSLSSQGPPYGPPMLTNVYAYADSTATNVVLSWNPINSNLATNYLIERGISNSTTHMFAYSPIASASTNATSFTIAGAITNGHAWTDKYEIAAVYPGGGLSAMRISPIHIGFTNGAAAPGSFFGYADATGTNLFLTWNAVVGAPTNYAIFGGTYDSTTGGYDYVKAGKANSSTNIFELVNGVDGSGNPTYSVYAIFAVYPDGSLSQAAYWYSADGAPAPSGFVAYFDTTGTNVLLSWSGSTGAITGYIVYRLDPFDYFQFNVNASAVSFKDTNAVNTGSFDVNGTVYYIQANYQHGGMSETASAMVSTTSLPGPTNVSASVDSTSGNVLVTWSPAQGAVLDYVIQRGVLNPANGTYSYSQIGTVGPNVTSFLDAGAITGPNSYYNRYEVKAVYPGGIGSVFDNFTLSGPPTPPAPPNQNIYLAAQLVRNESGRWQVMFSGLPTNSVRMIRLTWIDDFYDVTVQNISTTSVTNGVYAIPDADAVNFPDSTLSVQLFGPNGEPGQIANAGIIANDATYFVDGRRHLKQNLNFLIRAAAMNQVFFSASNAAEHTIGYSTAGMFNLSATQFEEFSFLHHTAWFNPEDSAQQNPIYYYYLIDNLWPFNANFYLANYLVDTARQNSPYGTNNFIFQPNFATNVPAPAILGQQDPYRILQPGLNRYLSGDVASSPPNEWGLSINAPHTNASLSSSNNLFGLLYNSGYLISQNQSNGTYNYQTISAGGNATVPNGYLIDDYAGWNPAPTLLLTNYYFAPLRNPGLTFGELSGLLLPGEANAGYGTQPFPVPLQDDFNVTNQTPPIIASVGQPMIIGGWSKYAIGSSGKFGYLGQYFVTNALLLDASGNVTATNAGVLSPYGEFFPLKTGIARFATMPDIDSPFQQGTGVVRIVSINVDANHDGVMDLSYSGPDQNSPSRPFRFWINDNTDAGDFGGNFGIPGQTFQADGVVQIQTPEAVPYQSQVITYANGWEVHGRRDLVDFFPVYLNIGSLFQSNALSAGISASDTNYQFILSQADSALRFAYTSLKPTNYMSFLQDTNVSGSLASSLLMTVSNLANGGTALLRPFLSGIATNNQGILLVEAWKNTTQPLVLSICRGTNQIAQTSIYLSMTGVEQMFRSKTMMLTSQPGMVPDRLTDADVPNEPDTVAKNFVFLHGYNVLPQENRGVAADMFKRMYWSGSHAKFYGVTWEGADTKGTFPFGNLLTPNYHTNVVNAQGTGLSLANFIATLTNAGPVVAAAHSLGNMVVLDAISDWNAPISQYFMLDSAVPIEAIDPATTTNMMIYSTWTGYTNRLFASAWYKLFPTNDYRNTLSWNNRLGNLHNVEVYNFYSTGEEVLRTLTNDPPSSVLNKLATQATYNFWDGFPFGSFTWYWQEKGKGTCTQDWFLGSSHGGWQFNNAYSTNISTMGILYQLMSPGAASQLTDSQLRTNSFFDFNSDNGYNTAHPDAALLGSGGSTYAQANRNRILADAIPAMSMVAGANPVPRLAPFGQPNRNIDMMTLENGWSQGRTVPENNMWHHSDFVQMAYTFTYHLYDQFVTSGNLK